MRSTRASRVIAVVWVTLIAGACGQQASANRGTRVTQSAAGNVDLTGAGSTFAFPLYSKWADAYQRAAAVTITYASTGSGDGVRRFSDRAIDFGATDGPMSDSELGAAMGGPVLHIPTALGADVVTYNLPAHTSCRRPSWERSPNGTTPRSPRSTRVCRCPT